MKILDKTTLKVGETIHHMCLGRVVFTETCKALEDRHAGEKSTLFVDDGGDVIEVTLALCSREEVATAA